MRVWMALALVASLGACQTLDQGSQSPTVASSANTAILTPPPRQAVAFKATRTAQDMDRDAQIRAQVAAKISQLAPRAFRAVIVDVWNGRVLLTGAVPKPEQRRHAEQTARAQAGVVDVLNNLVLAEDKALDIFTADPAREELVRRHLGIDGRTNATARVVNGVAYLLGSAPSREAALQLKADVLDVDGIKWAVSELQLP